MVSEHQKVHTENGYGVRDPPALSELESNVHCATKCHSGPQGPHLFAKPVVQKITFNDAPAGYRSVVYLTCIKGKTCLACPHINHIQPDRGDRDLANGSLTGDKEGPTSKVMWQVCLYHRRAKEENDDFHLDEGT